MLDFGVVKCDLFYAREVRFSIKMLREMRIIDASLVNCDSIVQIGVKIFSGVVGLSRNPNVNPPSL